MLHLHVFIIICLLSVEKLLRLASLIGLLVTK